MASIVEVCFQGLNVQPFVSGKGPKTASIVDLQGRKCVFSLGQLTSPFGAGTFDKNPLATRLGIEFIVPKAVLPELQRLDKWVVETAIVQDDLFPDWSRDDVAKNYHPFLAYSEKWDQWRVRCKFSTVGLNACRFWDADKMGMQYESVDTKTALMNPLIHASSLWQQGRSFGLTLNIPDMQVFPASLAQCPF